MTMKAFSRMASWRAGIKAGGLIQRFIQLALRRPNAVLGSGYRDPVPFSVLGTFRHCESALR
jgi:hypothetical protein